MHSKLIKVLNTNHLFELANLEHSDFLEKEKLLKIFNEKKIFLKISIIANNFE